MYCWMNKILHVDLSNSTITESPTDEYIEQYVGGRGIGTRIYAEKVAPEVKAFDPENRLIFMNGALVATGAQGATRMAVVGKSPGTWPEDYCYGNIGGFLPAELKNAGYDGVVITGRALKPIYLWIHDGEAEIRDASSLWGQGTYRTGEMLQQAHGDEVRFLATGVAGENRVRYAIVFGSHHSSSLGGFGAVMGSKNLKALAVRGTGKPAVADPEKLKELNRYTIKISKRISLAIPPGIRKTLPLEVIGRGGCSQCALECIRNVYRYDGRLEGNRKCQSMAFYMPQRYGREDEPIETVFDAPTMANDYSLDVQQLGQTINWLYECYNEGILTEQETGLPLSMIGTREFLEKVCHLIAYREGFGDILAEGVWRFRDKVSPEARALLSSPNLAPIGSRETFSPRAAVVQALMDPLEPRGHPSMFHEIAQWYEAWLLNQSQPELSPVTTKVVHSIARAFWGSDEAADFTSYEGKARAAQLMQNRIYLKDSLGLCDFTWPMMYSLNTPDGMGDPDLEAKLFTAIAGVDGKKVDLDRCGERMYSLTRVIMLREGRKVPEADFPLEYNFTEPLKGASHMSQRNMVPGPGEEAVDAAGNILDRDKYMNMLKEYYRLRGWHEETGIPRADTLAAMGLDDVASAF